MMRVMLLLSLVADRNGNSKSSGNCNTFALALAVALALALRVCLHLLALFPHAAACGTSFGNASSS